MNKKGMELSINSIVILIIAIITLGIILGFIYNWFNRVPPIDFPKIPSNPDADDTIIFAPQDIARNVETGLSIGFYNNEMVDVASTVKPVIRCEDIPEIIIKASGLNIVVGSTGTYEAVVKIPKNTPPGMYPCVLVISETEKAFTWIVK
jgi:hypothetical protein